MNKAQWLTAFEASPDKGTHALCKLILNDIDGYGVEYGFNDDDDASDLEVAFEALQEFKQRKID